MKARLSSNAMGGFLGLVWGFGLTAYAQTNSVEAAFQSANAQVAAGNFAEGSAQYTHLPTAGRSSAALEYNRGVAYLRLGKVGQARAHWLLAERLAPRQSAVRSALDRSAAQLPAPAPDSLSGPLSWTDRLTLNEWGVGALLLTWLWGGLLLLGRWKPGLAAALKGYTAGAGVLAVVGLAILAGAWGRRTRLPDAVILQPDTLVRVSPLDEARSAFSLPEGTQVRSQSARSGWYLVEDPLTRRFGWVKGQEILRLPLH